MWERIKQFFSRSETIAWARLQMFIGAVAETITFVDPSLIAPVLPAEWLPWFLILNGVATEVLRRLRAKDL